MRTPEVVPCDPKVCLMLPRALKTLESHFKKQRDIEYSVVVECGALDTVEVPAFKVYLKVFKMTGSKPYYQVFKVEGSAVYGWDDQYGWEVYSVSGNRKASRKKASDSYRLTSSEVKAVDFARGRYQWADIVNNNLRGSTLTLDNMTQHDLREAIDEEGIPLLDSRSDLYEFLIYLEPV